MVHSYTKLFLDAESCPAIRNIANLFSQGSLAPKRSSTTPGYGLPSHDSIVGICTKFRKSLEKQKYWILIGYFATLIEVNLLLITRITVHMQCNKLINKILLMFITSNNLFFVFFCGHLRKSYWPSSQYFNIWWLRKSSAHAHGLWRTDDDVLGPKCVRSAVSVKN